MRTNTPLEALYTLNGTQFTEAARTMAQRIMKEGGSTPAERIAFAHRLATALPPAQAALEALTDLYHSELSGFRDDIEKATKLLSVGESKRDESLDPAQHAAWTVVASTVLNMDLALTRN